MCPMPLHAGSPPIIPVARFYHCNLCMELDPVPWILPGVELDLDHPEVIVKAI